jgi:uncharacterized delta-60 repeat protein
MNARCRSGALLLAVLLASCNREQRRSVTISNLELYPATASVGEGTAYILGAFEVADPETASSARTVVTPGTVDFIEVDGSTVWFGFVLPTNAPAVIEVSVQLSGDAHAGVRASNVLTAAFAITHDLDSEFGVGGIVVRDDLNAEENESAHAVIIQPDGRIVIGGAVRDRGMLERYLPDGAPDPSFSDGGRFEFLDGVVRDVRAIVLQPDGKIVAVGSGAALGSYDGEQAVVARLLADGTVDISFGSAGVARTSYRSGAEVHGVALQPDGKIVIVGRASFGSHTEGFVARFTRDGAFDPGFAMGGVFQYPGAVGTGTAFRGVAIDTEGRIVVAGSSPGGIYDPADSLGRPYIQSLVLRINSNGELDHTFGSRGAFRWNLLHDEPHGVAIQPGGRIVVGGTSYDAESIASTTVFVAGITPAGMLDTTFADGGVFWSRPLAPYGMSGPGFAMSSAGEPVLVGYRDIGSAACLIRLTPDGVLDRAFSADGFAAAWSGGLDHGTAVAIQPDNQVVLAGWTAYIDGVSDKAVLLARFRAPSSALLASTGDEPR